MINLEASKTLLTFVLQRYLKLCRAMQCVAELPLLYRYLHLYKNTVLPWIWLTTISIN